MKLFRANSHNSGDTGISITHKQAVWLDEDLSENSDELTIVLGHHSLVPFSEEELNPLWSKYYIDNGEDILSIFEKHDNVSFYLSGHRHVSTRVTEENEVYHIVHPSTVAYPMRYTLYNLTDGYLEYEVIDIPVSPELWEFARNNFIDFSDDYGRSPEWFEPDEGVKVYLEYYEGNDTKTMKLPARFN